MKAIKKNLMVNGVKSSRKIEQSEKREFATIHRAQEVVHDSDKRCFGAVTWAVGRLSGRKEVVRVEIVRELRENKFFCDFGKVGEVADRAIVFEHVWVE